MEIINNEVESTEVGGDVACVVGCTGLCFLGGGITAAGMLALVAL